MHLTLYGNIQHSVSTSYLQCALQAHAQNSTSIQPTQRNPKIDYKVKGNRLYETDEGEIVLQEKSILEIAQATLVRPMVKKAYNFGSMIWNLPSRVSKALSHVNGAQISNLALGLFGTIVSKSTVPLLTAVSASGLQTAMASYATRDTAPCPPLTNTLSENETIVRDLLRNQQYQKVVQECERQIEIQPSSNVYFFQGWAWEFGLGNLHEAHKSYMAGSKLDANIAHQKRIELILGDPKKFAEFKMHFRNLLPMDVPAEALKGIAEISSTNEMKLSNFSSEVQQILRERKLYENISTRIMGLYEIKGDTVFVKSDPAIFSIQDFKLYVEYFISEAIKKGLRKYTPGEKW